jgi:hypothetical protein
MTQYSHQFLVAFTIETSEEETSRLSKRELLMALRLRGDDIEQDEAGREAFQHNDTEEI